MSKVNSQDLNLLNKRVKDIYSLFKIDEEPIIIEVDLKNTKADVRINNEKVPLDYEEELKDFTSKQDRREKMKGIISNHQMELLGTIDNEFYILHDSGGKISYIALNKKGQVYNDLFARIAFEVIDFQGIYNFNEDQIFDASGKRYLEKIYTKFINIDYKKINLYQLIHDISLLTYENSENKGNILFCHGDKNDYLATEVKLIDAVPLEKSSYKKIRKLLEVCNEDEDLCLLCNGAVIYGFGKLKTKFEIGENSFKINFKSKGNWKLEIVDSIGQFKKTFDVDYGVFYLNRNPILEEDFIEKFNAVFSKDKDFKKYDPKMIWKYTKYAIQQKHGTMLIVSNDAISEVERLSKQCFRIDKAINLNKEFIIGMTSIDGALFIDPMGYCHAIGTIIDGKVDKNIGDISRGARYNSALKYLFSNKDSTCLVIIVSEDGYIDVKTHNDLIIETQILEDIYYQNLLKWMKKDDLSIVKKAYEEYIEFDKYLYRLKEAEFLGKAAQNHAIIHQDRGTADDFEKIRGLKNLFLSEKIEKFIDYYNSVMQKDYY